MFKKLAKSLLILSLLVSSLSVVSVFDVVDAHEASFAEHQKDGNLENTLGGICSNDWCTETTGGIDLVCDEQSFPDKCQDVVTYCKNNPAPQFLDKDAHGKPVFHNGIKGCAAILKAEQATAEAKPLADAKAQAASAISELEGSIAAAEAGFVDVNVVTAAEDKLAAAKSSQGTAAAAETANNPTKAKLFYEKASQFANEGLQLLGKPGATATGETGDGPAAAKRVITGPGLVGPPTGIQGVSGLVSAAELGVGILNFFLSFVGIIAVAMLIYGGFLYITAAGDTTKSDKGRKVIIGSVIGIIIIIGSFTIVQTLITLQGGTGGGPSGGAVVNAVQVTISGTSVVGANMTGTVTVFQGQTASALLQGSTAGGFVANTLNVDVALDGATVIIGATVSLPAEQVFQREIGAVGGLRKAKVNITPL